MTRRGLTDLQPGVQLLRHKDHFVHLARPLVKRLEDQPAIPQRFGHADGRFPRSLAFQAARPHRADFAKVARKCSGGQCAARAQDGRERLTFRVRQR